MPKQRAPIDKADKIYAADSCGPENSVGLLMRRVLQSIVQQADARLVTHDLTEAQWRPLLRLHLDGDCSPAEMARDLQLDAGAVTRLIDRLERKSLCSRERDSKDRRVVHVALTAEGRRIAKLVPGVLAEVLNGHLADFSHEEWQQLMLLLTRMLGHGDAMRSAASAAQTPTKKA